MNRPSPTSRSTRIKAEKKSRPRLFPSALACCLSTLCVHPAGAHGFGYRYDLPLPLYLYVFGSSTIVLVTFLALVFWQTENIDLTKFKFIRNIPSHFIFYFHKFVSPVVGTISLVIFLSLVSIGFLGNQNTLKNLLPVSVWVLWWVGFVYITALCVNTWNILNPWSFCFRIVERILGREIKFSTYPVWLGFWPSALFLSVFLWIELIWPRNQMPPSLATLMVFYSLLTWTGMVIYGQKSWIKYAEIFSVLFSLIGKFSPLQFQQDGKTFSLQPHGFGLLNRARSPIGLVFVIIILLAGLNFDGFMATESWNRIQPYILGINSLNLSFQILHKYFGNLQTVLETAGFLAFLFLFLMTYILVCSATKIILDRSDPSGKSQVSIQEVVEHFIITLLPIAIGYHVAHYLSYLLIAGQLAIPLLSDPYSLGWDLLGTNDYRIHIGIINARTTWYVTLAAIILGHALSIFLSHVQSLALAPRTNRSLIQLPMVALMVFYTGISLWILAQPIVED